MTTNRIYNVGDEVRLLGIDIQDGFHYMIDTLSGLVGVLVEKPVTCKENEMYFTGTLAIKFKMSDVVQRDPKYTDDEAEDGETYFYFSKATIADPQYAYPSLEITEQIIGNNPFIAVVDEIKVQNDPQTGLDTLDVVFKPVEEPTAKKVARKTLKITAEKIKDGANKDFSVGYVEYPAPRQHSHYFKNVSHLKEIDVYRVLDLFEVTNPCIQHAVKKLLVAGGRGGNKNMERDFREAVDSINRALQMIAEDDVDQFHTLTPVHRSMDGLNFLLENFPSLVYKRMEELQIDNVGKLKSMYLAGTITLVDSGNLFDLVWN